MHIVEKHRTCLLNAVTAMTSFVQNTDCLNHIDVSSYSRYDQRNLEKKRFKEQRELEDRVSSREFLASLVSTVLFADQVLSALPGRITLLQVLATHQP